MTIWDIAQTHDGGVVFSAIAEYGLRNVKPVPAKGFLLTYNREGRLTKLWDVYPYEHHRIAIDDSGNVFGLGTKDTKNDNYLLLVKYSPNGRELGEATYPNHPAPSVKAHGQTARVLCGMCNPSTSPLRKAKSWHCCLAR